MNTKVDFKIGADPELFIMDGIEYVSAYGLLPGTKSEPHKVEHGAVQVDGCAFEFNIDPTNEEDVFVRNVKSVMKQMEDMIQKIDKNLKLVAHPVAHFDFDYFQRLPKEAKLLGCDPDYDFDGNQKVPKEEFQHEAWRVAGGHIHVGWTNEEDPFFPDHFEACKRIAKATQYLEFFEPRTILEKKRSKHYGQPGSFRPKSYGIELRAPSNRWLKSEKDMRKMFSSISMRMINLGY